ncbi:hypothetical protein TcasGA2_TC005295 [Tribolium castaneum]|uniref:Uncharacterized protein n=1 Tax=Tribolium castaneum TaxID=7070 RepID=D7ELE0_TRICA|nr:hypothetical protein TcasGA2_TC005295 [Tribolium castaneum]
MVEERLTGLALLHVHKNIPIEADEVITRFGRRPAEQTKTASTSVPLATTTTTAVNNAATVTLTPAAAAVTSASAKHTTTVNTATPTNTTTVVATILVAVAAATVTTAAILTKHPRTITPTPDTATVGARPPTSRTSTVTTQTEPPEITIPETRLLTVPPPTVLIPVCPSCSFNPLLTPKTPFLYFPPPPPRPRLPTPPPMPPTPPSTEPTPKKATANTLLQPTFRWQDVNHRQVRAGKYYRISPTVRCHPGPNVGRNGRMKDINDQIIIDYLNEQEYPVNETIRIKNRKGETTSMMLISLDRKYKSIYNVKKIIGLDVVIEPLKPKGENVQCHRCQRYGHVQKYCNAQFKCMKCAEEHSTHECPKERTSTPKCAKCGGEHISIWRNCPTKRKIFAAYSPPKAEIDENELDIIMNGNTPTLCAGDFNSKNKNWKCKSDNKKRKDLAKYTENRNLTVIAPTEPTHIPSNGNADILDIAIIKNITENIDCEILEHLNSDHYPVIIEISNSSIVKDSKIELHDINQFKQNIKIPQQEIRSIEDLEKAVEDFEKEIITAWEKSKYTVKPRSQRIPQEIILKIQKTQTQKTLPTHSITPNKTRIEQNATRSKRKITRKAKRIVGPQTGKNK